MPRGTVTSTFDVEFRPRGQYDVPGEIIRVTIDHDKALQTAAYNAASRIVLGRNPRQHGFSLNIVRQETS